MPDRQRRSDEAAVQFMIVDFLEEILKFSESPGEMGQYLTRQLRELMGVRSVIMLQHEADLLESPLRIVAMEPARARSTALLPGLNHLISSQADIATATLYFQPTAPPSVIDAMTSLGVSSLSLTPLRVGGQRVGSLLALDHLDLQRTDDLLRLLSSLAPVFALILRNVLHFESQEVKVIAQAEEYRALLKTNLDGILMVDGSTRILEANGAYLEMSGYSLDEIRQLKIADLEGLESAGETLQHTEQIKREGSDRFLTRHRRKDGSTFPTELSTTFVPSQDKVIAFVRDLTERVKAETALRESEAHHRELVEILGEGVGATDLHETFVTVNPEAEHIFGVGPNQLVGRNLREFMDDDEMRLIANQTQHRVKGQTDAYQVHIRRSGGGRRTLQVTATPQHDGAGQIIGSLAVFRDITEELQTQEALRLAQKMESLGNLAGGLAHDMNNVLGAILGLATAHQDLEPEGSRLNSTFATITKACLRGRNMVKTLLDFSRKDVAGERPLSLNEVVTEEARLVERTIPASIALQLDLDAGVGTILGDRDALSLMVMNLCVNAVDAMPEGGTLTLRTRSLLDGRVLAAIQDTGTGMDTATLEHALDPFFTTKPQGKGTGLGLSLAYSTVKAHHGDLTITSKLGEGTTIEARFPLAAASPAPPVETTVASTPSTASFHILLVDDDELIQSSVAAQLEVMGHQTTHAASGEEAMEHIARKLRPDLVILDMNMPGWGGARTLPRLRAALPDVPVLLSTGRMDQRAIEVAQAIPGVTILPKPYGYQELQATLAAVLKKG